MAEKKPAAPGEGASAGGDSGKASQGFTEQERAAMKERARELKAQDRQGAKRADGERAVLATITEIPEPDRTMAERVHTIVMASAPDLIPRT